MITRTDTGVQLNEQNLPRVAPTSFDIVDGFYFPHNEVSGTVLFDNTPLSMTLSAALDFSEQFAVAYMHTGAPLSGVVPQMGSINSFILAVVVKNFNVGAQYNMGTFGASDVIALGHNNASLTNASFSQLYSTATVVTPSAGDDLVIAAIFDRSRLRLRFYRSITAGAAVGRNIIIPSSSTDVLDQLPDNTVLVNDIGMSPVAAAGFWIMSFIPLDNQTVLDAWRDAVIAGDKSNPWP